jgi:GNAT superfamily N-acetyltransferase
MIRTAVESDADALADLSVQLGYPSGPAEILDRLRGIQARAEGQVIVAEIGGTVIGWIHILGVHGLESPAHAVIVGLVVDERHRNRGIGADLVAAAERWATAMRYAKVRARSNVIREDAHRFYRRLGYRETKRQAVLSRQLRGAAGAEP